MPPTPDHITVSDDGRYLAEATVRTPVDRPVHADLHVEAGHLPVGTRTKLVDAVIDELDVEPGARLDVTLPAGDTEILERLRERVDGVETRPAGSTCLVSGAMPPG